MRQLADGSLILGLYGEDEKTKKTFGATIKSYDGGKTWTDLALIGEKAGVYLDAETDVVRLKDGKLLAALRSSKVDMHYAVSDDAGKTWGPVKSFGFKGHCPYFLRHSSGLILLAHRLPANVFSREEVSRRGIKTPPWSCHPGPTPRQSGGQHFPTRCPGWTARSVAGCP